MVAGVMFIIWRSNRITSVMVTQPYCWRMLCRHLRMRGPARFTCWYSVIIQQRNLFILPAAGICVKILIYFLCFKDKINDKYTECMKKNMANREV